MRWPRFRPCSGNSALLLPAKLGKSAAWDTCNSCHAHASDVEGAWLHVACMHARRLLVPSLNLNPNPSSCILRFVDTLQKALLPRSALSRSHNITSPPVSPNKENSRSQRPSSSRRQHQTDTMGAVVSCVSPCLPLLHSTSGVR